MCDFEIAALRRKISISFPWRLIPLSLASHNSMLRTYCLLGLHNRLGFFEKGFLLQVLLNFSMSNRPNKFSFGCSHYCGLVSQQYKIGGADNGMRASNGILPILHRCILINLGCFGGWRAR
ncbi:hypothetical protein HCEG_06622 [Histoplasma capsulatum var. duboisii H88]|uniref:Uncharacterized protein n=1 Tax=Ajellomyces capsulatus (strain H88) TaxID=544711 RepID=F0UMU0_AJEC8|nr:hypothetical protein HCEG_06622 [Histoplasma capsulatum var. duboisii H88]QSS53580.1 hypothetical protein I7I53_00878 [Histoplasma capsulatum var. duboisii H88]